MRPIEKYGWKKLPIKEEISIVFYKGETFFSSNCFVAIHLNKNGTIRGIYIRNNEEISFEELQAIYETAKEIKEEK